MIIVAGFLGSGKTTLLLATIGRSIERTGKKVVVIVNDFGSIGIDATVMNKYGLEVAELASGCICCTLGPDLLETVEEVAEKFSPDTIVIEPTGVADPHAIVEIMQCYKGPKVSKIKVILIIDAVRFTLIVKALGRPLAAQLRSADLILINKADAVSGEAIDEITSWIKDGRSSARILAISASNGTNLDEVVEELGR